MRSTSWRQLAKAPTTKTYQRVEPSGKEQSLQKERIEDQRKAFVSQGRPLKNNENRWEHVIAANTGVKPEQGDSMLIISEDVGARWVTYRSGAQRWRDTAQNTKQEAAA